MNSRLMPIALALTALAGLPAAAWAQQPPGSDPIVMAGARVSYLAMPTPPAATSEQLHLGIGIPSSLQAKIARYEAKAFAQLEGGDGTVYTNKDVVSRQTGNALQRTCTTDVASNTITPTVGPSGRYGPGTGGDQIAVLRGDVVTICK